MARRLPAHIAGHGLQLPAQAVTEMRADLASVADRVVAAIIAEVPSYDDALTGSMGENIRNAVQLALGGFLSLAGGRRGADPRTPTAPSVEGAYQLGRGEARAGRTTDALLSAYRIGARVSWREMSTTAVRAGMDAETLGGFAELVFAYIDELSAASVAGHADELATTGRVRQRLLERLARQLLTGAPAETVLETATRAEWEPPTTLTAVLMPDSQVRPVLVSLPGATIAVAEAPDIEEGGLLLVPDAHGRARGALLRTLEGRDAVAGPARPWLEASASLDRARRARALGVGPDTEAHLPELVLAADADARADLRAAVLAPLDDLRPATAEKLTETLRSWLLHQGRRDAVAEELFVHPQTVRYRMGQLRELFGDDLEDPATVLALVIALG
ncbi:helix-turn-helix domain-containing protein [Nocardioides sp. SOB44]|uniref:Helix-turn-helix domain-containing protein n=1 Tax=Nocardioides cremeus TaxID=3058044 RepID=A0ABT8TK01_9ACTN|nr:helix-turn-helix domain-containing protein [Nocardioides cremeus]MDO3394265.1 helix-turn-helix domain-containing protein [Nocardioides cremeus]